jgi:pyridoxal phosphate enzyme (YggS family)
MITDNLLKVQNNIQTVCHKCGQSSDQVTLIAVSKTKPIPQLKEIYDAGIRDFGENKVQELVEKYDVLPKDIRWHMIGHLQRNKVKYIVDKVYLIHSVDSFRLAEEISLQAIKKQVEVKILIEVNIAQEATKFGVNSGEVLKLVSAIAKLSGIHIMGLMVIAPFVKNSEDNRSYFKKIRELAVDIKEKNIDNVNMNILSMGMSGDYLTAIEEGATMVRVGTNIFGERDYFI